MDVHYQIGAAGGLLELERAARYHTRCADDARRSIMDIVSGRRSHEIPESSEDSDIRSNNNYWALEAPLESAGLLGALPALLVVRIASMLPARSVCRLAACCASLRGLVEAAGPLVWRSVPVHVDSLASVDALGAAPAAAHVRILKISPSEEISATSLCTLLESCSSALESLSYGARPLGLCHVAELPACGLPDLPVLRELRDCRVSDHLMRSLFNSCSQSLRTATLSHVSDGDGSRAGILRPLARLEVLRLLFLDDGVSPWAWWRLSSAMAAWTLRPTLRALTLVVDDKTPADEVLWSLTGMSRLRSLRVVCRCADPSEWLDAVASVVISAGGSVDELLFFCSAPAALPKWHLLEPALRGVRRLFAAPMDKHQLVSVARAAQRLSVVDLCGNVDRAADVPGVCAAMQRVCEGLEEVVLPPGLEVRGAQAGGALRRTRARCPRIGQKESPRLWNSVWHYTTIARESLDAIEY
eukprot:m51a1_g4098 hypothetical protein (472) ;mRNA; f:78985-80400